jgi:hypothetical protein
MPESLPAISTFGAFMELLATPAQRVIFDNATGRAAQHDAAAVLALLDLIGGFCRIQFECGNFRFFKRRYLFNAQIKVSPEDWRTCCAAEETLAACIVQVCFQLRDIADKLTPTN